MSQKGAVPDAWEDDWESLADKPDEKKHEEPAPIPAKVTKAERRARHAELNRQIWESAENPNPEPMMFLEARDNIPLKDTFKPSVTVLSRRPTPQVLSRNDPASGMAGLALDDEDSEEERRKQNEASFAERKARATQERAEKERRYAEARERLFGSPAASSDDAPNLASPNKRTRGKGRGRGGRDSQPRSSNEQSPARPSNANRQQLFDPTYAPKPNSVYIQRRDASGSRPGTPSDIQQPVREPRGPQSVGRGGRGFAPRGNHTSQAA